ncbi:MAG: imelysin family protein [Myxococcota bacterium]
MLAAIALTSLWSCGEDDGSSTGDLRRQTLDSLGTSVIMPMYRDIEAQSAALNTAAQAFCAAPDTQGLTATRQAWWDARAPWKMSEVLAFGPYDEEPVRLGPKMDFWPIRETSVQGVLEGDGDLTASTVAELGAASKGFPAIEWLLYADGALEEFENEPRRCAYLTALTEDLATNAQTMREAWDPEMGDYLGELVRAGEGSEAFDTLPMAVGEVANRMAYMCENIRRDKLNPPLGAATTVPQPETAESRFSGRSVQDIIDNLRGVEALFRGQYGDQQGEGFAAYATQRGIDLEPAFDEALNTSITALEAIPGPLTEAVSQNPEAVEAALEPLRQLQRVIQTDMLGALGVSTTFNDNDGD